MFSITPRISTTWVLPLASVTLILLPVANLSFSFPPRVLIFLNFFSSNLVSAGSLPNSDFLFPRFATFLAPDGLLVDFP